MREKRTPIGERREEMALKYAYSVGASYAYCKRRGSCRFLSKKYLDTRSVQYSEASFCATSLQYVMRTPSFFDRFVTKKGS
jgi:hypothetical protein